MIEKLIVLEDIDPVIFYGVNNANMQLIKALYPKLRIVARGNVIKVLGDEEEMCAFEENITKLEKYCAEYNSLKEEVIIDIIKGNAPQAEKSGNVIVFSVTGKPIIPRSENQLKLVEGFAKNDMPVRERRILPLPLPYVPSKIKRSRKSSSVALPWKPVRSLDSCPVT